MKNFFSRATGVTDVKLSSAVQTLLKRKIFLTVVLILFSLTGAVTAEPKVDHAELIQCALEAQKNSYAPYSNFNVGAAVLCASGKIYTGANVENASYPAGNCAEHTAISHAIASGERKICAIAIVGGTNFTASEYCAPCGICRQVMREFAEPKKFLIIMAKSPTDYVEKKLEELLPMSFDPDNLK